MREISGDRVALFIDGKGFFFGMAEVCALPSALY